VKERKFADNENK